ncbi:MAG: carboxypeptidase regulatory-like domain-containing protein [Achromobacter sp.]|uniref:carboxypeptidase regulatory-like domain-containing protein n=1 Tax=Achromobacter sp. TaxID=134375 RepID=UPI003D0099AF
MPYPVYKTMQPDARITVLGPDSQPVADTRVVLISSSYPYGRERFRHETRSGSDGVATFQAIREWRVESMMLHGSQVYFWNWCVEKEGYETYETRNREAADFDDKARIQLRAGESRSCNSEQPPRAPRRSPETG